MPCILKQGTQFEFCNNTDNNAYVLYKTANSTRKSMNAKNLVGICILCEIMRLVNHCGFKIADA